MSILVSLDSRRDLATADRPAGRPDHTSRRPPALTAVPAGTAPRGSASWSRTASSPVPAVRRVDAAGGGRLTIRVPAVTAVVRVTTRTPNACLGAAPRAVAPSPATPGSVPVPIAA